jgi:hypothetical protein
VLKLAVVSEKISPTATLALLDKPYEPGIVGFVHDYKLQVVKVKERVSSYGTGTTRPTTSFWF